MSALCQVSWIFPAPCYCTFYSTSPSQKQRTHSRYLSRQMSYDSSFLFHSHSVSIGSVFGVSFAHQRLSNHRLHTSYIYVVASNTFRKSFPQQLLSPYVSSPCSSLPLLSARAARKPITLLQTLCCKIFVLKYFRRTPTLRKIYNTKIFPPKILYNGNFPIYGTWITQ